MNATTLGFVVGLMIAAVLIVILFKYANKDGRIRTQYDERQKAVRGKAYKYAFYTEVFSQAVIMLLFMSNIDLPIENYALIFTGILLGCIVLATYCIWNDVYWGLNNNHKRYHVILIIAIALNLLAVVMSVMNDSLFENGKIGMPLLNIVVLVMMFIVYVELLIKKLMDRDTAGEG